jgi:C_GCAxxG_C_C family probable redox protein
MTRDQASAQARALFLDDRHPYGCAETVLLVLKEAFGLPDPEDPSPALALNGGVAYSGGTCGAISGAAIAVGLLAGRRVGDHAIAKGAAREIVAALIDEFTGRFGAVDCRALLGHEIRSAEQHRAFVESGAWRRACMDQVVFAVERLADLDAAPIWDPEPASPPTTPA